jgi:superoxide reductase
MDDKHFIEWIELTDGDATYRHYLKPGTQPVAVFPVTARPVTVREYCTLHGLWKA